ncbi:carboxypeptidase-like regulatory domain-containing protein [Neolewinella lacunae]|uniref:Carboxypeptidase-like regulatory domain-containing protein n=1 Tax=Neolewinella lacunae TaxID=1517758 RepID=A0A923TEC1_9BACT|nr:carboxypeptidase-like regulatory domain-containing protein [Neolewinella lacunae]MBC6995757.1 carboxypeptidase-like regulatory domain-containing protein [Neolewinella lacunae]MDN3636550.1 carboxypeptidase-like regulatory domain-containing protein [Neolewinella lacunae]
MHPKLLSSLSLLVIILLLPGYAAAQSLRLSVVSNTGEAVPYATVFAVALEKGLITDDKGQFTLDWENAADTTTVTISSVGFQTTTFSHQHLSKLANANEAIVLPKATYTLADVEVRDKRLQLRKKRLGLPGFLNATYIQRVGSKSYFLEAGPIIRPQKRCRLDAVELRVQDMDADTVLMDVNVYALEGSKVQEQLLRERLFVSVTRQEVGKDLTVNLLPQDLWIDGDFLVTFRLLKVVGNEGKFGFKGKTGYRHGLSRAENGKWEKTYVTPALFAVVSYE